MKIIQSALIAGLLIGSAHAGVINFSSLLNIENITNSSTGVEVLGSTGFVHISYDPESADLPLCAFNPTGGGIQAPPDPTFFPTGCVGAQVSSAGVFGTTEGVYIFDFDDPISDVNLTFGIFSLLPDVTPDSYSALGLVTRSSTGLSDFLSVPGMSGTFQYSSAAFDRLEFRFSPSDPYQGPELDGIIPSPVVGMTIASISDVSASPVPEP